jgi:RND family efflux transporter MFP subunit
MQIQAALLAQPDLALSAGTFATDLAVLMRAERVAVGFIRHGRSRVVGVSHATTFRPGAQQFDAICAAMDESIEQDASIAYPEIDGSRPHITAAHAALARRDGACVASVPLVDRGRIFGALTLQRSAGAPFDRHDIAQCEQIGVVIGPLLQLKFEAEHSWLHKLLRSAIGGIKTLAAPGHAGLKAGVGATLIALGLLAFAPVDYRIGAPARVEGAIQRALVAPADGFLRALHVRPGDRVKSGQVLAELAQDDLRLEQHKWESELAQYENTAAAALARADRAQFVVNQSRADEARAQLDLASKQLNRTQIVAPFDGVVIAGDLTQKLGAPVQRGEALLTIAPDQQYRLVIEVDERDIVDVRTGANGHLALGALIGRSLAFEVIRITPMASAHDGRNFFEVEGKFEGAPSDLRPGLQGVAKIEAGSRTTAWIWTHHFFDWLRLALWSWGG